MKTPARALIGILMLASLAACAVAPPDPAEILKSGDAVVLFRYQKEVDGAARYPGFALGDFETGGETVKHTIPRGLDSDSWENGWVYLQLKPGTHYLAIQPQQRTNMFTYLGRFRHAPRWRIEVPQGAKAIYAGTLVLRGPVAENLFGQRFVYAFDHRLSAVVNEEKKAAKLFAAQVPQLGPPRTLLMVPHTGPVIIKTPGSNK